MSYKLFIQMILFSLITLGSISCNKDPLMGDVVDDSKLCKELYAKSTDTIIVDSQKLVLETELTRDFFPGGMVQSKRRMYVSMNVVNTDSLPITNKIEIQTLYVVNKDRIWISNPESRTDIYIPTFKAYRISLDGPEWETGILVDVVVAIKDLKTSELKFLIARNQEIKRID